MGKTTRNFHGWTLAGICTAAFVGTVAPVHAQNVTINSSDGSTSLTGELLAFEDGIYTLKTTFGEIRLDAALVECVGEACPTLRLAPDAIVTWDVSLWGKRRAFTEHVEELATLISEKTDGRFTLNLSYGGLSDSRENLDGISDGSFEMAQFCAGYHPEKNPSLMVLELPFLGVSSLEMEAQLSKTVYQHPATVADMARWNAKILMPTPLPQMNIIGVGFPPTSLESFVGMPMRATGGIGVAVEELGSVAKALPATQVAEALESGEIEAVSFAPHAHMAFGTVEKGNWWTTNLNPGTLNCPVAVSTTAYDSLPDNYQDALMSSLDDALDHFLDYYNGETMSAWGPALEERGIVQITITEGILEQIRTDVAAPAAQAWIEDVTVKGLPGQELYDLVMTSLDQYR